MSDAVVKGAGRYAPSPTGDLHIGNLRTAVLAWAFARGDGLDFCMRVEDLDRVRAGSAENQLQDLKQLGLTWREPVVYQHLRGDVYQQKIDQLMAAGLVYECYCSRKDIQNAASAPHLPPGAYPGTCRDLDESERVSAREALASTIRQPALRLRAGVSSFTVQDRNVGAYTGGVDDFVLRRGDGVVAYNLAVVIDDAAQGVMQVCRGDDLLDSSPRQSYLAELLGLPPVEYVHVPLVLNSAGARLAKRDGAVSLRDLCAASWQVSDVLTWISASIGIDLPANVAAQPAEAVEYISEHLDPDRVFAGPTTFVPPA